MVAVEPARQLHRDREALRAPRLRDVRTGHAPPVDGSAPFERAVKAPTITQAGCDQAGRSQIGGRGKPNEKRVALERRSSRIAELRDREAREATPLVDAAGVLEGREAAGGGASRRR